MTVTVEGAGAPAPTIALEPARAALALPGATLALHATTDADAVTWGVVDVATDAPATTAAVSPDGVLTATAPGVYEVTARAGAAVATSLVSVDRERVPGPHGLRVVRPEPSRTTAVGASLRLNPAGGSLWATGNGARNIHLVPGGTLDVGESATVRMVGRTGTGYEEAGLILYTGDDDYVAVQRKHANGSPALRVVTEIGGASDESCSAPDPAGDVVWLRLTRTADALVAAHSTDGTTWTTIGSPVPGTAAASTGVVGVLAAGSVTDRAFDFSELRVADRDVPLVRDATPPVASGAVATATPGAVEATWSYTDADGDAQDGSVVRWYVAAGDAWEPFATGARVDVPAAVTGRAVRAVVVPRDASGSLGAPVASAPVAAVGAPVADDDASLSTLALGNAVPVAEGTWAVGPSATAVAVHAAATHPDAEVAVLGGEPLPGGGAVVPLAEGGTTVEVRVTAPSGAVRTWTAVVERRGDRDAGLAEAAFSVGLPGVGSGAFHVTPVADDVDRYTARLVPSSPGATVSARLDGRELAPGPDGSVLVPVHRGATVLEVRVTAGDGATTRVHRWVTLSERAAAPFVAVDAQSRCLAGRAHVAVRADNHGTSPLDVTLTTDLGSRAVTGLTPGRSAYQSFPARAASTSGGVAVVEVVVDGERHLVTVAYPALDC